MPDTAPKVMNHDLVGLDNRINRFLVEFHKSVSSSQGDEMLGFDITRAQAYLNAITAYQTWITAEPQLDLPETAPRLYQLEARPVVDPVENESVNDMMRMMVICRDELCNSQSARRPCGLNDFDNARLTAVITKMTNFIENYVLPATPLDMPESSPKMASSGAGRTGIEP